MSFTSLLIQTATVYLRDDSATDRYGNDVAAFDSGNSYPCRLDQTQAQEVLEGRDTRVTLAKLFLPPTAAIEATSEVEIDGDRYRVLGRPAVMSNFTGPHHIEAQLELIEG